LGLLRHVGVAVLLLEAELHSSVGFASRDDAIRSIDCTSTTACCNMRRRLLAARRFMNFMRSEEVLRIPLLSSTHRCSTLWGREKHCKVGQHDLNLFLLGRRIPPKIVSYLCIFYLP
jgi:hypothetical protein